MRSIRMTLGFRLVLAAFLGLFVCTWLACVPRLGVCYACVLACAVHFAALLLALRLCPLLPALQSAPSYTLHEALVPYAGKCAAFEDPAAYPDWACTVEDHAFMIEQEFELALSNLHGEPKDGWIVDRNAALMTKASAWQHLEVEKHCPDTFALLQRIPVFAVSARSVSWRPIHGSSGIRARATSTFVAILGFEFPANYLGRGSRSLTKSEAGSAASCSCFATRTRTPLGMISIGSALSFFSTSFGPSSPASKAGS